MDNEQDPDQKLQWLSVMAEPISTLKIAPIDVNYAGEIKLTLRKHGCLLEEQADHVLLTFPRGTTRKEVLPHSLQACFDIFLPDGFLIREVYYQQQQISYIYIPASSSEIELQGEGIEEA
jgi:hypothetical protein